MRKLLVICGPTATGKTSLAANLSKKFDGVLVSADSRQVYIDLNIGTGKEYPSGVQVLGYDLVEARGEFSVAQYEIFAREAIKSIWDNGKLPILVGGTGLYIKSVIEGVGTSSVPKNQNLRKILENLTVDELFEKIAQLDPIKAASLNISDKNNPRRLIRAIEIAQHDLTEGESVSMERFVDTSDVLMIGLKCPKEILDKKIESRVKERIKMGAEKEVRGLLEKGVNWKDQSMSSIGYGEWKDFFEHNKTLDEVVKVWTTNEVKYTKRQMTWFKKNQSVNWFDISSDTFPENVEKKVDKWYSSNNESN